MGIFDIFSSKPAQDAAGAQTQGIIGGLNNLTQNYGNARDAATKYYTAGLQPFQQNYNTEQTGVQGLTNALGLGGPAGNASALSALRNTPGYQFSLEQGDNAINAAAAANGKLGSGNQLLALSKFNQGLADTTYNNYISQLQPFLSASNAAASGIGGLNAGLGNTLATSLTGQGNAGYGAWTSAGNAAANADLANYNASGNLLGALLQGGKLAASGGTSGLGSLGSSLFSGFGAGPLSAIGM